MIKVNEKNFTFFTLNKNSNSAILNEAVAHAGLRICLILQGSADWLINDCCYNVQSDSIVFLNSTQKRRFLNYGDKGISIFVITLDYQAFMNMQYFLFFCTCINQGNNIFNNKVLSQILTEIYNETRSLDGNSFSMISAKLTEFFIKAQRILPFSVAENRVFDIKFFKILEYIHSNITEKITLKETAELAGFTECSFSRYFSKLTGTSFKKYVMTKKIEYAIFLLEHTDLKVIDCAYECGFDSISGFYDTFKKVTGTTPRQFVEII